MLLVNAYENTFDLLRTGKRSAEESPDDLQINHQIRVEAHLVA